MIAWACWGVYWVCVFIAVALVVSKAKQEYRDGFEIVWIMRLSYAAWVALLGIACAIAFRLGQVYG